jgi:hypothetical protein
VPHAESASEEMPTTPFEDVLPEVMAQRGIKDLDELYSRYQEAGGTWDRESFMSHARGEDWGLSPEFFAPVRKANCTTQIYPPTSTGSGSPAAAGAAN